MDGAPELTEPRRRGRMAYVVVATCLVAVLPPALALALRLLGVITSPWLSMALAVALALIVSNAGSAYWRRRRGGGDAVFSELLVWGWLRRRRQDRQLANAVELLDLADGARSLDPEDRERLLRQLAEALEGRDVYLGGHSRRVARHATMIARGLGLPAEEVARVRAAAAIHDVGKLRTPASILNKPDRLTDAEFEVIKRHPVDGAELVAALGDPELTRIVRHHHERLDGGGYPDRLAGEGIPLGSRIIAVADTFDAITSARPYRSASPHQRAIDILRAEAGAQLDPGAVRAFLDYYSGKRPTVACAVAIAAVRRLIAWLSGDSAAAATMSAGKVAAATAASAVIAVGAGAPVAVINGGSAHAVRPAGAPALRASVAQAVPGAPARALPLPAPVRSRGRGRGRATATSHATSVHTAAARHPAVVPHPPKPAVARPGAGAILIASAGSVASAHEVTARPAPSAPARVASSRPATHAQPPAPAAAPSVAVSQPTPSPVPAQPPPESPASPVASAPGNSQGGDGHRGGQGDQGGDGSGDSQGGGRADARHDLTAPNDNGAGGSGDHSHDH